MPSIISIDNFDLLTVGVAVSAIGILGFVIYFNNKKSLTNRLFLTLSIATIFWGISNYLEYRFTTVTGTLWALRTHLFISTWHAFAFFSLAYVFPKEKFSFPKWYWFFLLPLTVITSIITFTPFVFSKIVALAPLGEVTNPERGLGIILFTVMAFGLLIAGLCILVAKITKTKGLERRQMIFVFTGMFVMAILISLFNLILPVVFNNLDFIPYAALFVLPFISLISYAIYKHHLFNIKVAAVAFVAFILTIFSFFNILYAQDASQVMINVTFFVAILIGTIILIQSVLREIEQREKIESLAKQLDSLVHLVSHEVKGALGKNRDMFGSIIEGDFGEVSEPMKKMVAAADDGTKNTVDMVMDILNSANVKSGILAMYKKPFDMKTAVEESVTSLMSEAQAKGLSLKMEIPEGMDYTVNGDREKIVQHVIRNLIDNSIRYTQSGAVTVGLLAGVKNGSTVLLSIKDTGVGITSEDMSHLFTEGGRGKDSVKVNVHSTGYGLYFAKNIVDAHGGKIWAESEGAGKGSQFYVELPGMPGGK